MPKTAEVRRSTSDVARDRAAVRDTLPAVVLLFVTQGSLILLNPDGGASAWNLVWSLLPLAPALWLVWAQVKALRRSDEYQHIVQLEAMAIGFGAVVVLALAGGLFDAAGIGQPKQYLQITFIGGIVVWVVALAFKTTRAR
ncbi:MAG: hypothetical protein JWL83_3006 [Actinomycetia bacterium]|nr:hypothetical protein [Actinomycetes bacterium]